MNDKDPNRLAVHSAATMRGRQYQEECAAIEEASMQRRRERRAASWEYPLLQALQECEKTLSKAWYEKATTEGSTRFRIDMLNTIRRAAKEMGELHERLTKESMSEECRQGFWGNKE